jgi:3-deoxy-manno-octulosonate cytidylyltransferase (CMP-KDO synthetase)
MVEHVYRRASAAHSVGRVIVATEDEQIRDVVTAFGGEVRLTASTHATGTDRVAEVAATLDSDIIVNVQGDLPLIEPTAIDDVAGALVADPTLSMSTLKQRLDDPAAVGDPNVVKVVTTPGGDALYFSRSPIPFDRRPWHDPSGSSPAAAAPIWKHVGIYGYRRTFLLDFARLRPTALERTEMLEQLRALEHGYRIRVVETTHDSIEVDTPQDLERVRERLAAQQHV